MSDLTKNQIGLMKHAIGYKKSEVRNWFGTDAGSREEHLFDDLVGKGYATKEEAPNWAIDDFLFRLTPKGIDAVNQQSKRGIE